MQELDLTDDVDILANIDDLSAEIVFDSFLKQNSKGPN